MASTNGKKQKLTPREVGELWGVSPDTVIAWIRSGELHAIDGSQRRGGKPRYLVDLDDLRDFERRRAVIAKQTASRRRPPRADDDEVIEFFK